MHESRLKNFPVSFFSIALGLAGFTLTLSRAEAFVPLSFKASSVLRWVALAVFALTGAVYLAKVVRYRSAVAEDDTFRVERQVITVEDAAGQFGSDFAHAAVLQRKHAQVAAPAADVLKVVVVVL